MRCSTLRGTFCSLITLATPRQDWTGCNPSRREGGGCGFTLSRSHSCCAVRLVYTQIRPGHIWTTLYLKVVIGTVARTNWKQCGRLWSSPNIRWHPEIFLGGFCGNGILYEFSVRILVKPQPRIELGVSWIQVQRAVTWAAHLVKWLGNLSFSLIRVGYLSEAATCRAAEIGFRPPARAD